MFLGGSYISHSIVYLKETEWGDTLKVLLRKSASTEATVMGELTQSEFWFYSEVSWKWSVLIGNIVRLTYCLRKLLMAELHTDVKEHTSEDKIRSKFGKLVTISKEMGMSGDIWTSI